MKPWMENITKTLAKSFLTWLSYTLLFSKIKKGLVEVFNQSHEQADYLVNKLSPAWLEKMADTAKAVQTAAMERDFKILKMKDSPEEEDMAKEKKQWSFFKVIMVIGILIAIAIFILDRLLPKPYEDEDLDDAWAGEDDDYGLEDEEVVEVVRPPTADVTYDVNEEDKEEEKKTEKKEEKKKTVKKESTKKKDDTKKKSKS
ncbi:MAG: hypothetical protein P9L92_16860 [Candidatus Electryonea clarkiae]|nr:hypothetical protein [Candidatus Electryonea clarkiae]MDP8286664.1 hypothetical protein [Candidatus Electryonea clarkiae]